MEEPLPREDRPCAHCGGTIAADDTTCATCGRSYIPDAGDATGDPAGATPATGTAAPPPPPPPGQATYAAAPPPTQSLAATDESRLWAMGAHLGALAGVLMGGLPAFLAPLIVWLLRRDERDPFAAAHAREALNFNLSVIIYSVVGAVLAIATLGLGLVILVPLGIVAFVVYLVVTVKATVAASRSEYYAYPFTIRMVR